MKYILSEKLMSIGNHFTILDENKNKLFYVDGKVLTIGEKLYINDTSGKRIFTIKKKLIRLTDTYSIEKDGKVYATLRKDLINIISDKFDLKSPYGDIRIKGNFIDYDYKFKLNGDVIANVSKKFIAIRDKYIVEIDNFEDPLLILACTVIIDMISHENKNRKNDE